MEDLKNILNDIELGELQQFVNNPTLFETVRKAVLRSHGEGIR